jgi:hypothetical protein
LISHPPEELGEMTEWLFQRLAAGGIERDVFHRSDRLISHLRAAIERARPA